MKRNSLKILITLPLLVAFVSGCWFPMMPDFNPTPAAPPIIDVPIIEEPQDLEPPTPGQFTLRYNSEMSMNPIIALNRDNISITSLLFESLFVLDENLYPVPVLCIDWYTEDNITFTFEIMPDVPMHDGTTLTASDVAFSIRQARNRGRHVSKLRGIESVSVDGELTVSITLTSPNARFIRLLDIPIIKYGSLDERIPPGSGPFHFPYPDAFHLQRFTGHRHFDDIPIDIIHLRELYDSELTSLFDDGSLSLLWDDPTGAYDIRLNRLHEPRYYNTTALQFIGFNATSWMLRNSDVRRAIGNAIDRQYIVDVIMTDPRPGQTIAAPVPISPVFDLYDPIWEFRAQDPLVEMAILLSQAGLEDVTHSGFLDIPDGYGGWRSFNLDFIVNVENAHKLAAANNIAEALIQNGINTTVRALPWSTFISELNEGNFDMFYGETLLGADFDLSPLLLPGDLNFGRTASTAYQPIINSFLAAVTPEEVSIAGRVLIQEITINAPFVPILFKRHAIYTPIGVVTGATPSQSGVFHNFQDWSIDVYMLN